MQDENRVIETEKFTIKPISKIEVESYLSSHLGASLIKIININYYTAECNVKTEDGNKTIMVSLPTNMLHNS